MDVAATLQAFGLEGNVSGDEYRCLCIFHKEEQPSLNVRLKDGVFHCLGCGASGRFDQLLEALGVPTEDQKLEPLPKISWKKRMQLERRKAGKVIRVLSSKALTKYAMCTKRVLRYMKHRGLTRDTAKLYGVREGKGRYEDRVVVPIRDEHGRLISFSARHMESSEATMKMRKCPGTDARRVLFGVDVLMHLGWKFDSLVLVEGEFDAMSGVQCGYPTAALMGWRPTDVQFRWLHSHCTEVILCLDSTIDVVHVREVAKALRPYMPVRMAVTRQKDLNDALAAGGRKAVDAALGSYLSPVSV